MHWRISVFPGLLRADYNTDIQSRKILVNCLIQMTFGFVIQSRIKFRVAD